ncbi:hypothetical protein ACHAXS_007512 [Conticribra weissflogii]
MTMKLFSLEVLSAIVVALPPFFVLAQQGETYVVPCRNAFWNEMQLSLNEFYESTDGLGSMDTAMWIGIDDPIYGSMYWTFGNSSKDDGATPGRPASIDDHFEIGSISKTFGATANLLLMESGEYPDFTLNATVREVAPTDFVDMFPQYADFTMAQLMGMQTDIPDFFNDPDGLLPQLMGHTSLRYTIPEIVAFAMQRYPEKVPEDCEFNGVEEIGPKCAAYSSPNILVMEHIAEHLTGRPMQQLVRELVLEPLGMSFPDDVDLPLRNGSGVRPDPAPVPYATAACVESFNKTGATIQTGDDLSEISRVIPQVGTAGSMYATVVDLLRWAATGTGDDLFASKETIDRRHDYVYFSLIQSYGLGQYRFNDGTPDCLNCWYGHDGESLGFTSFAYRNDGFNASIAGGVATCGQGANYIAMEEYVLKIKERIDAVANGMVLVVPSEEECNASSSTENKTTDSETETTFSAETSAGAFTMSCAMVVTMSASILLL